MLIFSIGAMWWLANGDRYFHEKAIYNEKHILYRLLVKKDARLEVLLKEVLELCSSRGFIIPNLEIRSVNPVLISEFAGTICHPIFKIFVYRTASHSDDSLRVLIAHEVGHAVSKYCSHHPFLKRVSKISYNGEDIADFVVVYLYGKEFFLGVHKNREFRTRIIPILDNIEFTRHHLRA